MASFHSTLGNQFAKHNEAGIPAAAVIPFFSPPIKTPHISACMELRA